MLLLVVMCCDSVHPKGKELCKSPCRLGQHSQRVVLKLVLRVWSFLHLWELLPGCPGLLMSSEMAIEKFFQCFYASVASLYPKVTRGP